MGGYVGWECTQIHEFFVIYIQWWGMGNMEELTKIMENIEQKFLVYHKFFIIYYNDG